jgi:MraZ protein
VLLGEYHLSLDDKGRLSIPAVLRHTLHDLYAPDDQTLVVTKYFEHCLVIYPKAVWMDIQQQLLDLHSDPSTRAFLRQFCASASLCHLDRQGRILIPPKLRQYADIASEALLIGVMRKLEVWSPVRWEAYDAQESGRFDTQTHARLMELRL